MAIESLLQDLTARDIYCRQIKVDVASHSAQVDPILRSFWHTLGYSSSTRRGSAAVNGHRQILTAAKDLIAGEIQSSMDAQYWVQNLRHSVLFAPAIKRLCADGKDAFIELSPHPILLPSIEASARANSTAGVCRAISPPGKTCRGHSSVRAGNALYCGMTRSIGEQFYPEDGASHVTLPQYPFQRERCWPEPAILTRAKLYLRGFRRVPLLGHRFESSLDPKRSAVGNRFANYTSSLPE